MSSNIWEIEELSYILGTSVGGNHGNKRRSDSAQSTAGHPEVAQVLDIVYFFDNSIESFDRETDDHHGC